MLLASIPSPSQGVWHLGDFPIRAYALFIILGVVVTVIVCQSRLTRRGGPPNVVADIAVWAVPFGLVGARLYNLATSSNYYWGGPGRSGTIGALEIWHGGLGIWGGIALGALGAWIGCRRYHVGYALLADSIAPGLALAEAIGRWGNYFNQELYGRATGLPWALHITHSAEGGPPGFYQPTWLYESLWDVGVAVLVVLADRHFRFTRGRAFALYVASYTVGRFWIEWLRVDEAHHYLGLRLNDWTSIIVFLAAITFFVVRRPKPGDADSVDAAVPVDTVQQVSA